jgi:hypothetical protein
MFDWVVKRVVEKKDHTPKEDNLYLFMRIHE